MIELMVPLAVNTVYIDLVSNAWMNVAIIAFVVAFLASLIRFITSLI